MANPAVYAFGAVLLVSLISLIGAVSISNNLLQRHRVLMGLIALAAGTLIGDSFLHLLPEASHEGGFTSGIGLTVLLGFVIMFAFEVILRRSHSHVEAAGHHGHIEPFGWLNLVGDALHNLLDGVILAAAFIVDIHVGFATTIAVLLHEIPQELGDFAVLVRSGMSKGRALLFNLGSAMFAVLGAALVFATGISTESLETIAVPLIVGAFLYIAAADLIPELHHHNKGKDALLMLMMFLVGITLMYALLGLEGILEMGDGHDH